MAPCVAGSSRCVDDVVTHFRKRRGLRSADEDMPPAEEAGGVSDGEKAGRKSLYSILD
jgi:hypothetical protein